MAKKDDKQEPLTLQEYIIARLEMPVAVKGGGTLKDPVAGHERQRPSVCNCKQTTDFKRNINNN